MPEENNNAPTAKFKDDHSREKGTREKRSEESLEDSSLSKRKSEGLSGEDFMFLLGLGLFITFLALAHPSTWDLAHSELIFWMSATLLFLSMVPDYVNKEVASEWLEKYRNTKVEGIYERIYHIAENGDRYFNSRKFFIGGVLLTLAAIVVLFYAGMIIEILFGVSYGFLMRAILI